MNFRTNHDLRLPPRVVYAPYWSVDIVLGWFEWNEAGALYFLEKFSCILFWLSLGRLEQTGRVGILTQG